MRTGLTQFHLSKTILGGEQNIGSGYSVNYYMVRMRELYGDPSEDSSLNSCPLDFTKWQPYQSQGGCKALFTAISMANVRKTKS